MNIKKYVSSVMAAMLFGVVALLPGAASAEEQADTQTQPAVEQQATENAAPAAASSDENGKTEEDKTISVSLNYKYTSPRYGYTIMCPGKPTIVPASMMDETAKGDILIFANKGMEIIKAWIVLVDGYDEGMVPKNLGQMSDEDKAALNKKFCEEYGFGYASVVDLGKDRYGMYCITAKEVDVDTNGDGKFDDVMVASNQMVKTFLEGEFGGRFAICLLDNPVLSKEGIAIYNVGLTTFKQWPTSGYQNAQKNAASIAKKKRK